MLWWSFSSHGLCSSTTDSTMVPVSTHNTSTYAAPAEPQSEGDPRKKRDWVSLQLQTGNCCKQDHCQGKTDLLSPINKSDYRWVVVMWRRDFKRKLDASRCCDLKWLKGYFIVALKTRKSFSSWIIFTIQYWILFTLLKRGFSWFTSYLAIMN